MKREEIEKRKKKPEKRMIMMKERKLDIEVRM